MTHKKGQTLIEMVVVVGIVVLLATGIVAGTTASLARSKTAETRSEALSLAQAGIELAREARDSGWTAFTALNGHPQISTIDIFTRTVTYELIESDMKVTSTVTWGGTDSVYLVTYLTQWR